MPLSTLFAIGVVGGKHGLDSFRHPVRHPVIRSEKRNGNGRLFGVFAGKFQNRTVHRFQPIFQAAKHGAPRFLEEIKGRSIVMVA